MTKNEADHLAGLFIDFLETGEPPEGLFAADALCDFTMPKWRVQAEGSRDVVSLRLKGHPGPGKVTSSRVDPTESGFVIEVEEEWPQDGENWYCREMMRADVENGSIKNLSVYCTGDWDSEHRARHAAAVKMIRP